MEPDSAAGIDPQEHVDAIYKAADVLRESAKSTDALRVVFVDPVTLKLYDPLVRTADDLVTAAEAFIDMQTEHDALIAAATELLEQIDRSTDCMSNEINRHLIDPWIEKLQLLIDKQGSQRVAS